MAEKGQVVLAPVGLDVRRRISSGGFFLKAAAHIGCVGTKSGSRVDLDRVRTLQNKKGFCVSLDVHRYYNTQQASRSIHAPRTCTAMGIAVRNDERDFIHNRT